MVFFFILLTEYYNSYMVNIPNNYVKTELILNLNDTPFLSKFKAKKSKGGKNQTSMRK